VTEVRRQPYLVYGHLRTADAVSPVAASAVTTSLVLFVVVYAVLLLAFFFYAARTVFQGPPIHEPSARRAEVWHGVEAAGLAGGTNCSRHRVWPDR
jgi:cytochrome bd ubiquinol oxidase subunit I